MHEDNPDPEALKRTIRRLRDELEDVKLQLQKKMDHSRHGLLDDCDPIRSDRECSEIQRLREENALLTTQVKASSYGFLHSNALTLIIVLMPC